MIRRVMICFLFSILLSVSLISAAIFINEIELDPAGSDVGTQWIEVYNSGTTSVSLTGWYLNDTNTGNKFTFPSTSLASQSFYVLHGLSNVSIVNERWQLFNGANVLQDDSGFFNESLDNGQTLSRVPDGANFVLQQSSLNASNVFPNVANFNTVPTCLIRDGRNFSLTANVSSFCISSIEFLVFVNGTWQNYTPLAVGGGIFVVSLNSTLFPTSANVQWQVIVNDCFNRTFISGVQNSYLNNRTSLLVSPNIPDGLQRWYVNEPSFSLVNPDSATLYYRWDASPSFVYSGPFGLENIPNQPSISAGTRALHYWSDVCSNESDQQAIFFIDLVDTGILDLNPVNGSTVYGSQQTISTYLEEFWGTNSGVNFSSVVFLVDGVSASFNLSLVESLDAQLTSSQNLSLGNHSIFISVADKSGRMNTTSWQFEVQNQNATQINIISPVSGVYSERRIYFNITSSEILESLSYLSSQDLTPSFKPLCSFCNSYGFFSSRSKTFFEGNNSVILRVIDIHGVVQNFPLVLFVDSIAPRITQTLPRSRSSVNGSFFSIKYTEDNLQSIDLVVSNNNISNWSFPLTGCFSGDRQICSISTNLSFLDGQEIESFFVVRDMINTKVSRISNFNVDVTTPMFVVNSPQNVSYPSRYVLINISVSEEVTLEYSDLGSSWKRLCSSCSSYGETTLKKKSFTSGSHNIIIRSRDSAGNAVLQDLTFTVP